MHAFHAQVTVYPVKIMTNAMNVIRLMFLETNFVKRNVLNKVVMNVILQIQHLAWNVLPAIFYLIINAYLTYLVIKIIIAQAVLFIGLL